MSAFEDVVNKAQQPAQQDQKDANSINLRSGELVIRPREVARRVFACEVNSSTLAFKEQQDDPFAPTYILTPTGAKCNRVFVVGVLIDKEDMGDNMWRATIADHTDNFALFAGQYNLEAASFLSDVNPPLYVAAVGRLNMFKNEAASTYVSIRPEHLFAVSKFEQNIWEVETAIRYANRLLDLKYKRNPDVVKALEYYKPIGMSDEAWLMKLAEPIMPILSQAGSAPKLW